MMETSRMKVVFSSIINGKGDLQANGINAEAHLDDVFKPEIQYRAAKTEKKAFQDTTSHEVLTSLINASNCANLQNDTALDGYLTCTAKGAFLYQFVSK